MNMKSKYNLMLKLFGSASIIIYILLIKLDQPSNSIDYITLIPEAIGFSPIPVFIFEKWIWKWIPFIKIPKLKREYIGLLKYNFNDQSYKKDIKLFTDQTLTTVRIKLVTDEVVSNSIIAEIVEENGDFILYYCYRTNPYSEYSDINPIQIGTCRLNITNPCEISGVYWTNRKTKGDIFLFKNI